MAGPLGFLQSVLNGTINGATEAGQGLMQGAQDAFNLPRDVYQGKVQTDPRYMSEDEFARTLNLAGNVAGGGITMGTAPEGAIGMFAGQRARTADMNALSNARAYEAVGRGAESHANTGWYKGVDDKWKFEIPDNAAALKPGSENGGALMDVLNHPELFKAYPELQRLNVENVPGLQGGSFDGGKIRVDLNNANNGTGGPLSTLLHETQHGVQALEGFAPGANPADTVIQKSAPVTTFRRKYNDAVQTGSESNIPFFKQSMDAEAWKAYSREAGEVEARAVQRRQNYTPEMRQDYHPVLEENIGAGQGTASPMVPAYQQWINGRTLPFPAETYNPNLPFLAQYLGK